MALFKNGKKIRCLYQAGERISSIYKNGQKIYQHSVEEPRYLLCSNGNQWVSAEVNVIFDYITSFSLKMSAAMFADPGENSIQANGTSYNNFYIGVNSSGKYVYPCDSYGEDIFADGALHEFYLEGSPVGQSNQGLNLAPSSGPGIPWFPGLDPDPDPGLDPEEDFELPIVTGLEINWTFKIDDNEIVSHVIEENTGNMFGFYVFCMKQYNEIYSPYNFIAQKLEYIQLRDQGSLIADMWPVPQGKTLYGATSPAPSNCLYCKVRNRYYENMGSGNFTIEQI